MTSISKWKPSKRSSENEAAHLIVLGINYHSSPLAIRERFIIPSYCMAHALQALAALPHVKEAAVLSTCNRTEVYAVVSDVQAGLSEVESFFASTQTIADHGVLKPNFKLLRDDVALHLLRVASGLDSMVIGEGQIMSQVKTCLKDAQEAGTAGPALEYLFNLALKCGKRVRTETSMARRAVSVSSAAVELAREKLGSLKERTVLIIGAGKMAKICAKHVLNEGGSGALIMINRTSERVTQFAEGKLPNQDKLKLGFEFDDRYQLAANADLVIVSTSAPGFVLKADELKAARTTDNKDVCIVDISAPRNVEPAVENIDGIALYDSDHLAQIVNKNLAEREALVSEAETLVFETLDEYHAWQRSLLVVPTITGLRKKIESIRVEQIRKTSKVRDAADDPEHTQAEQISRAIINQILHHPTVQLKATHDYQTLRRQAEALQMLFDLDILADTEPGWRAPGDRCPV